MILLAFILISGPVGDYLGYDFNHLIAYQGYDSLYFIIGSNGDSTIYDTVTVIDTLSYGPNPAYLSRHMRVSDLVARQDTLFSWEAGDTLFTVMTRDTVVQKSYITPFYTGLQWDLDLAGETLIIDIDMDSIYDTLVVQTSTAEVVDSVVLTVPLGTFDAFKITSTINVSGWQSYINDSCRIWIRDNQWLCPYAGVIKDSIVLIDTAHQYVWLELLRLIMYSEAVDSGHTGITEMRSLSQDPIQAMLNGIIVTGQGSYRVDIYDLSGRWIKTYDIYCDEQYVLRPVLSPGIYFASIKNERRISKTKFIIIK
jgi:hypothetical protein